MIIFSRAGWRFIQPRPLTVFGEPIDWIDTNRYLRVTLDTRLTWSPHIDQVRRRTAQRMCMLGPFLNRKSDQSIRNGVLLYKQLILPLIDYACPTWRSAARSHVRRLQVLQSKYLRLATGAPCYVCNMQIHEDLSVLLFADNIRAPSREFWLKVSWFTANRQILKLSKFWPRRLTRKPIVAGDSRPVEAIARDFQVDKKNRLRRWTAKRHSFTLTEVFRDFPQL